VQRTEYEFASDEELGRSSRKEIKEILAEMGLSRMKARKGGPGDGPPRTARAARTTSRNQIEESFRNEKR